MWPGPAAADAAPAGAPPTAAARLPASAGAAASVAGAFARAEPRAAAGVPCPPVPWRAADGPLPAAVALAAVQQPAVPASAAAPAGADAQAPSWPGWVRAPARATASRRHASQVSRGGRPPVVACWDD